MKRKFLLLAFSVFLFANILSAQTWNGTAGTDWNTPTNWSTNAVPTSASSVTIANTPNKPVLASNTSIASITMDPGSALDFNGFTLSISGTASISGATLSNSKANTDIVITMATAGGGGSCYIGNNAVNDNITLDYKGSGYLYEGYGNADIFNGNTILNIGGTGTVYTSYSQQSSYLGNLTITRTTAGITNIFNSGFAALSGNFSYTNSAGGASVINPSAVVSATISGKVDITVTGAGNPSFEMSKIKNATTGGTVTVQNSGGITIQNDTLLVSQIDVSGISLASSDNFSNNYITGNVTFSDATTNTGSTYVGNNTITGNTIFGYNSTGYFYEGYSRGDTFNGSTTFDISGTGTFYTSYSGKSFFNGNLTVNRTGSGPTYMFNSGFGALTGNFSYTNNTGGLSSINANGIASAPIGGKVNISATGPGNPTFELSNVKNATSGGIISVQNSGGIVIQDDTLILTTLNVSGFTLSASDNFRRNSITGDVTFLDGATKTGSTYIGQNTIVGNTSYGYNSTGYFYEGYGGGDNYNGNADFSITGTGTFYTSYSTKSSYTGDVTINRTGNGSTYLFDTGFSALTGNLIYNNSAGGLSSINGNSVASATIGGTINISVNGAGNPAFEISKIANATTGGTISVQNSGAVTLQDDTLLVTAIDISGFTLGGSDNFMRNSIAGNVTFSEDVSNTGSVYVGRNIINGDAAFGVNGATLWYESYSGSDIFNGNVIFSRKAGTLNVAYSDTTHVNKDLTFNSASGVTISNAVEFGGSFDGIIDQLGTQSILIPKLVMNKMGVAKVVLNDTVTVSTSLNLASGNIISGTNSPLNIPDNVTYIGGSDISYVDGPVLKTGNEAFVFPLGQNNVFAPISITAPANVTDQFRGQYIADVPNNAGYDSTKRDPTLDHISSKEYWLLDRTVGTSNVKVSLSWDQNRSGVVNDVANLKVARWNGSTWKDEGNGATTGNNMQGTVQSLNAVTNFSPFTLASANALNPLPITLLNFTAARCDDNVCLQWSTENEKNASHFEIERANGDNDFKLTGSVNANNNLATNQYTFSDKTPGAGANFYRLKIIDADGSFRYSKVLPVIFNSLTSTLLYPNPARDEIKILSSKNIISIEISDLSGRLMKTMAPNSTNRYNIGELKKGLYIVKISGDDNTIISKKLIIE